MPGHPPLPSDRLWVPPLSAPGATPLEVLEKISASTPLLRQMEQLAKDRTLGWLLLQGGYYSCPCGAPRTPRHMALMALKSWMLYRKEEDPGCFVVAHHSGAKWLGQIGICLVLELCVCNPRLRGEHFDTLAGQAFVQLLQHTHAPQRFGVHSRETMSTHPRVCRTPKSGYLLSVCAAKSGQLFAVCDMVRTVLFRRQHAHAAHMHACLINRLQTSTYDAVRPRSCRCEEIWSNGECLKAPSCS